MCNLTHYWSRTIMTVVFGKILSCPFGFQNISSPQRPFSVQKLHPELPYQKPPVQFVSSGKLRWSRVENVLLLLSNSASPVSEE